MKTRLVSTRHNSQGELLIATNGLQFPGEKSLAIGDKAKAQFIGQTVKLNRALGAI